jgi:hypothetical protein
MCGLLLDLTDGAEQLSPVVRSKFSSRDIAAAPQRILSGVAPMAPITIRTWEDMLSNVHFPAPAHLPRRRH